MIHYHRTLSAQVGRPSTIQEAKETTFLRKTISLKRQHTKTVSPVAKRLENERFWCRYLIRDPARRRWC